MRSHYLIGLFCLFSLAVQSRELFIVFDDGCMDKMEYQFQAANGTGTYVTYSINLDINEKILLEVGEEDQQLRSYVPANFLRCDNGEFNEKMMEAINRNVDQVYVVFKVGYKQYFISRVKFATYYKVQNDLITVSSPKYDFQFDFNTGIIGENLSVGNNRAEVYFEGRLDNVCSGAYIFRQYSNSRNMPPHIDVVVIPEIGIVEERSGRSVEDALNNAFVLNQINSIPLQQYMNKKCANIDIVIPEDTVATEGTYDPNQPIVGGEPTPGAGYNTAPQDEQHLVRRGETLYRISQKYGVSVRQIQQWNNMGSGVTIFPGDRIWVNTPGPTMAGVEDEEFQQPFRGGDNNPAPYDNVRFDNVLSNTASAEEDVMYQVRPGETVASIALKFGFTEAKLREMNSFSPNQIVRIGQVLKVSDCDCKDEGATANNYVPQGYSEGSSSSLTTNNGVRQTNPRALRNVPTFYETPETNPQATEYSAAYESYDDSDNMSFVPSGYNEVIMFDNTSQNITPNSRRVHIVQDDETIFSIARKYKMTVDDLRTFNNLERGEVVIPFQKLYLE